MQSRRWLLQITTILYTRHYMLRPPSSGPLGDGVRVVLRAALDTVDGDDWRQCEAVANLIAKPHKVIKDWQEFYSIVGPQVRAMACCGIPIHILEFLSFKVILKKDVFFSFILCIFRCRNRI